MTPEMILLEIVVVTTSQLSWYLDALVWFLDSGVLHDFHWIIRFLPGGPRLSI